jgi:hypothetical protein
MDAMSPKLDESVVIDGNPRSGNLGGYANYAPWEVANAMFIDDYRNARQGEETRVLVVAKHGIPHGQEIRVDYDTANPTHEYRKSILAQGASDTQLDSNEYLMTLWEDPPFWLNPRAEPPHARFSKAITDATIKDINSSPHRSRRRRGGVPTTERFVQLRTRT